MKIIKNKWFWIALVIVIALIGFIFFKFSSKEETSYVTEKAKISDLSQTVEVTGSVESADDIDLNFTSTGTLQGISVKVGDSVKAGQTLASLFAGDVASQVADARANLELVKTNLREILAGASNEDINVTNEEVASAETSYQAAQDSLKNLESTRDQELASLREIALNTLSDKSFVAQYSLDLIYDSILDQDAENDLFVSDVASLNQAKDYYVFGKSGLVEAKVLIDTAKTTENQEDILVSLDSLNGVLKNISNSLLATLDALRTAVSNGTYTVSVIDSLKSDLNTQSTAVSTALALVQDSASDIRTRDLYYQTSIIDKENSVSSALNSLNLAKAKLDLKQAPARDFEIDAANAKIRQAEATLNRYLSNWSETIIKAPVEGIISKVNFDKGEQTSLSSPVISMIGLSEMEIKVDVPESDITKLAIGDPVNITLDAFSAEDKFFGTVTFVDPASTLIDGVVYYKVTISFNQKDDRLKSGMTADLTINTDSRTGVMVVPSRAVIYREDKKYVQVLVNGQLAEKEVTTGLKGDGGLVEILSGLNEGEEVITYIKNGK
ncbi:MAG: efflux RND transporter periplasmic adaptor subunit [bacterium]|nr:efflux RND transporter periplasmic adaptor subunit [bacterium]